MPTKEEGGPVFGHEEGGQAHSAQSAGMAVVQCDSSSNASGNSSSSSNASGNSSNSSSARDGETQANAKRGITGCASEPVLWRSAVQHQGRQKQQERHKEAQEHQLLDSDGKQRPRRRSSSCQSTRLEAPDETVALREACASDAPLVRALMKSHLRSLILPAVFYWLCRHAQDFGSFLVICCCFVHLDKMLISLCCFLMLLLIRVVLELEQYAARGCPDLAEFDRHYLQAERNRFWVAEKKHPAGTQIVGCIGFIIHPSNLQEGQLVRLVVSPGSRGAGVGSRLLSSAVGFAASCRCRSIEVFANSLNASSASFFRNRQFELVQVVRRNLMRGDLLRWRMTLDCDGRTVEPKTDTSSIDDLQSE
ncbi:acetyltransferase domain-containing protein, putative [Eimeria necatrix]|uniref:Acetyltransferase domain-containing protein, putative n=1 Tax=Eimeria necatrix TaxID=51315 RepID=U6MMR2_9EIME|nr:acetyltransferase domain-containing protein, putative [Eimeria necatrix]CDJ64363.1 acetyltransferase domain-containing protein, putative [Eimeria necatrix]